MWGRERGLFEGGDYFEYFNQKGAILRGRRLIEGSYVMYYSRICGIFAHVSCSSQLYDVRRVVSTATKLTMLSIR